MDDEFERMWAQGQRDAVAPEATKRWAATASLTGVVLVVVSAIGLLALTYVAVRIGVQVIFGGLWIG